jgi:hypothetical protein
METTPAGPWPDDEQLGSGEHNEIGFYNADEEKTYNERGGTQGESPGADDEREIVT